VGSASTGTETFILSTGADFLCALGAQMTQAQAANIHAQWKQSGESPCEHPIQELVRLARSDDGNLMGTYHCRECGEAIIYTQSSSLFSKGDSAPNSSLQVLARCVLLVKTRIRSMRHLM
jgi:hypothetical protein